MINFNFMNVFNQISTLKLWRRVPEGTSFKIKLTENLSEKHLNFENIFSKRPVIWVAKNVAQICQLLRRISFKQDINDLISTSEIRAQPTTMSNISWIMALIPWWNLSSFMFFTSNVEINIDMLSIVLLFSLTDIIIGSNVSTTTVQSKYIYDIYKIEFK
jgi:hypothetical protein